MTGADDGERPRVALATSADWPALSPDDEVIAPALARIGIDTAITVWTDAEVAWERFDAIVVRSCWNYHDDLPRWLDWISALERRSRNAGAGARPLLVNAPSFLRWNARKTYLNDLAARGVPIVPTRWLDGIELDACQASWSTLEAVLQACGWDELIVKPAVSAGARFTHRLRRADLAAWQEVLMPELPEMARRGPVLIQPYLREVADEGEWSLLFFDGIFSHAVSKRPAPGDFRVQERHGGTVIASQPPSELRALSQRVLAAAASAVADADAAAEAAAAPSPLLYARVDLVVAAGRPMLMELEIIEPALYLQTEPPSPRESPADRFAGAIARRLDADPH